MSEIIDIIEKVGVLGSPIIKVINVIKSFTNNEESENNKKIIIITISSIIAIFILFGLIEGYDNYKLELAEVTQEEFDEANLYRVQVITCNKRADAIRIQKILKEGNIDTEISQIQTVKELTNDNDSDYDFRLIAYKSDKGASIEKLNEIKVKASEEINKVLIEAGLGRVDIGVYAENKYIENAISDFKNFKTQYETTEDNKEKNKLNKKMNIIRSELKDYLHNNIYEESEKKFQDIEDL